MTIVCLLDLPYMVTLITKLTSLLNSRQKMVPEDDEDSCYGPSKLFVSTTNLTYPN